MSLIVSLLALTLAGADEPGPAGNPQTQVASSLTATELLDLSAWVQRFCPTDLPTGEKLVKATIPWPVTLPEAIRMGLANSEGVRLVGPGVGPCADAADGRACCAEDDETHTVITQADGAGDRWQFKSDVMTQVRAIEQHYWTLAELLAQLGSVKQTVTLAEDVLRREKTALAAGHGTAADVAEATERLEQFRLDVLVQSSELGVAERRLRQLLGLPPVDSRRIIPVTRPVETQAVVDWNDCRMAMLAYQPDIAEQRSIVQASALRLLVARGPGRLIAAFDHPADTGANPPADREAQMILMKQRDYLNQIVLQSTHTLARSVLEVEASSQQLQAAGRLRHAAVRRLEAQRAAYEEGRITIERYLDAVQQSSRVSSQESRLRTAYNHALAALEEVKGTLLDSRNITVADPPRPGADAPAKVAGADPEVVKAGGPVEPDELDVPPRIAPATTTIKFDISVGRANPVQLRGSVSIVPARAARDE